MDDNNLYIIAGCNAAGKATASFTILPENIGCKEFVSSKLKIDQAKQNGFLVRYFSFGFKVYTWPKSG